MAEPRIFVVAVDSTEVSKKRLEKVIAEFVQPGDEVHLAHVVPEGKQQMTIGLSGAFSSTVGSAASSNETAEEKDKRRIALAKAQMKDIYIPVLSSKNIPYQVAILVTPSNTKAIGDVLSAYADKVNATALVIGKSDRTAVQEIFLGSVCKEVLKRAHTTVMAVA